MTFSASSQPPFEADLEIERLIGEVAQRHNVLISPEDPIFITLTLNQRILERYLARLQAVVVSSQDQIAAGTAQHVAASKTIAANLINAASDHVASQARAAVAAELRQARQITAAAQDARNLAGWAAAIAIAAAAIAGIIAVVSPLIYSPNAPAPECRPVPARQAVVPPH